MYFTFGLGMHLLILLLVARFYLAAKLEVLNIYYLGGQTGRLDERLSSFGTKSCLNYLS